MKPVPSMSFLTLVAGLATCALAIACGGGGSDDPTPTPTTEASTTPSSTATPSPSPTATTTPSPSPTPFDGKVARMKIPSLSVDYPIEELGLIPGENQLDTPHNAVGAIGWYHIYAKPGFRGNAIFSAHVNWDAGNTPGPFYNLYQIQGGDKIVVDMADGPSYTYEVFAVRRYAVDPAYTNSQIPEVIDMGKLINATDKPEGEEWVTLITCSCAPGRYAGGECFDRDVVLAKRVS